MKISLLKLLHRWQLLNKQNIEIMKSLVGSDAGRGFFVICNEMADQFLHLT